MKHWLVSGTSRLAVLALLLCASGLCAAATSPAPPSPPGPNSREEALQVLRGLRRIVTPQGIESVERVRIGGIDQFLSIRSHDPAHPVLLVLHGGPGWVAMPTSWWFARGWEEYFTVVQWDQRGAGKTYVANDPARISASMTVERMHSDTDEVVQWLRKRLGQKKVFVMGHSWGSVLGLSLAARHPEWLHAYIGVAQGIDARESERRGWRWARARAVEADHATAIADLDRIAPYAKGDAPLKLEHIFLQRKWLNHFGGAAYRRPDAGFEGAAIALAPEYTDEDVRKVWEAQDFSVEHLLAAVLETDLSGVRRLEVPLVLFLGRHDHNLSAAVAAEWFARVEAPTKQLVWFEHSAHELLVEEPGKVLVNLVEKVRPLASPVDPANLAH